MHRVSIRKKWVYSMPWSTREWAQRDYDALNLDPEIEVLKYGSAPVFVNGEQIGYAVLFWLLTSEEKYQSMKETLKETHKEDIFEGLPLLKCAMNVERVEPA